ncbi:DUF1924 domain-containing protein [Hydrogenophilus thiooxidans]|uniref:DUF1924 domain-containing protein n=1 Tax=Hydrogenophilus thiooxidans TaxID=2820326 RepID=UPI001C2226A9|nr:DUF1924 domain-containing protein [Hydrogenophilus thiooxidans]
MLRRIGILATLAVLAHGGTLVWAAQPTAELARLTQAAQQQDPNFQPSSERGRTFYFTRFAHNSTMPSCSSCHGDDPRQEGRHTITGKRIKPLAPVANPERFTDSAKIAKWFRRNCTEVVGRECTLQEQADLLAFLSTLR